MYKKSIKLKIYIKKIQIKNKLIANHLNLKINCNSYKNEFQKLIKHKKILNKLNNINKNY